MWDVSTLTFLRSLEWSILDKDIREGKQRLAWCYFKTLWTLTMETPAQTSLFCRCFLSSLCLSCEAKLFSLGSSESWDDKSVKGIHYYVFLTHLSHFNVYFTTFNVFNLPYIMKCVHSYCRWCAHKQFQIIYTLTYVDTQPLRQFF